MPSKNNSLASRSNEASSGWKRRRGYLNHCGHGNDEPIGPRKFCVGRDGLPPWALAVITVNGRMGTVPGSVYPNEDGEGSGMSISDSSVLCLPISFFLLKRGLDNPVCSALGSRNTSWGVLVVMLPFSRKLRGLSRGAVSEGMSIIVQMESYGF